MSEPNWKDLFAEIAAKFWEVEKECEELAQDNAMLKAKLDQHTIVYEGEKELEWDRVKVLEIKDPSTIGIGNEVRLEYEYDGTGERIDATYTRVKEKYDA